MVLVVVLLVVVVLVVVVLVVFALIYAVLQLGLQYKSVVPLCVGCVAY